MVLKSEIKIFCAYCILNFKPRNRIYFSVVEGNVIFVTSFVVTLISLIIAFYKVWKQSIWHGLTILEYLYMRMELVDIPVTNTICCLVILQSLEKIALSPAIWIAKDWLVPAIFLNLSHFETPIFVNVLFLWSFSSCDLSSFSTNLWSDLFKLENKLIVARQRSF